MLLAFSALPFYLLGTWRGFFLLVGFGLQTAYILTRGFELGRLPLVGPHDTLALLSASIIAFSFPFLKSFRGSERFRRGISVMAAVFTVFSLVSKQHNAPLPPVLKTIWFELHVVLAFLSYALFGIGALIGCLYLADRQPAFEPLQYRSILIGYCLFSLSMIFGGIWAYLAWGTYWLWTPKELWTAIVWVVYSLYLHARLRPSWMGALSSAVGIAGFFIVLFTYLGVSLLMKSSHTF